MKVLIAITLLFSFFTTHTYADDEEGKPMSQTQEKILSTITTMTEAFQKGDIDTVMNSYEQNAVVIFEPNNPISKVEEIMLNFKGAASINPKFTYSDHEVFVAGDIAIHIAPWEMAGTTPDGQKVQQGGLSVAVLRKQKNGEWRMIIDNPHANNLLK